MFNKDVSNLSNKNLVIIAVIMFFLMVSISINMYLSNNRDRNGNYLTIGDIIKNIFNRFDDINLIEIEDIVPVLEDTTDEAIKFVKREKETIKKTFQKIKKKIFREKEVFNINENNFTYKEAQAVCKALGTDLATYEQVLTAHEKGANWCNYGWSQNQMALYPTQEKVYRELQTGDVSKRGMCGKPGVNGGFFQNADLKFGVNCYGTKPKPDPGKIVYTRKGAKNKKIDKTKNEDEELIRKYKDMFSRKEADILPFNNKKWSSFSYKKSQYILTPKDPAGIIYHNVTQNVPDKEKEPGILDIESEEIIIQENVGEEGGVDEENE